MFPGNLLNGLREIRFGLAQGLRTSDFGAGLLDDLMGQFNRLLNRRIERVCVLFSHAPWATRPMGPIVGDQRS